MSTERDSDKFNIRHNNPLPIIGKDINSMTINTSTNSADENFNEFQKNHTIEIGKDDELGNIDTEMSQDDETGDNKFPYPTASHSDMPYDDREFSWLKFNYRVLELVGEPRTPLLEKVKFLSIANSNLDEFFSVRVASRLQGDNDKEFEFSKMNVMKVIKRCNAISADIDTAYFNLMDELASNDIIVNHTNAGGEVFMNERVQKYFSHNIKPALAPLILDETRPLPHIKPFCIYIACIIDIKGEDRIGLIEIPTQLDRMVKFKHGWYFIEDIIISYMDQLYPGLECTDIVSFRLLRDGVTNIQTDDSSYVDSMAKYVQNRILFNDPIKLEVYGNNSKKIVELLRSSLKIKKKLVFRTSSRLKMSDIMQMYDEYDNPEWKYESFKPSNIVSKDDSIMDLLEERDIIVHHPYESFNNTVVKLIKEAATDDHVISIKMTLYRSGVDTKILKYLIQAAESGKNVAVMIELAARYNESDNIEMAEKLQKAGATVVYGYEQIKTHAKLIHIFRKKGKDVISYCHIGTGNYSEKNSKIYTDLSYFTTNSKTCSDVNNVFNMLTGGFISDKVQFNKLKVAPLWIRPALYELIDTEISKGKDGFIIIKINNLSDHTLISKLYDASNAGVNIHIICRGSCSLIAGVAGYSENINVKSIVGRVLEHSRVFIFGKNESERIFITSADMMPRNLDRRCEILFEIVPANIKKNLRDFINIMLADELNSYGMTCDGNYVKLPGEFNAHTELISKYQRSNSL